MTKVPAPFLFRPERVAQRLASYPALAREVKPRSEGCTSASFVGWRTSGRQIYKLLANVEGTHGFDDVLERIDYWLARGFGAVAFRSRDRGPFRAGLSELEVADHFEARGFAVR